MIMKKTFVFLVALLFLHGIFVPVQAQEDNEDYAMWETIMLTPDNTKLKLLGENLRNHNQKYHGEGPYSASIYNIVSGPHTGKMIWIMGPLKFPQLDARPAEGGHDEDWRDNVMPYLIKTEQGEYWRADNELSNVGNLSTDPADNPILFTRYLEVNVEHQHQLNARLKTTSATIKAMEGENPWGVYYNLFRQGNKIGRHIATVSFYKNWTDFDRDPKFKDTFLKDHNDDDWYAFMRDTDLILDDSWDEIWVFDKFMSGK